MNSSNAPQQTVAPTAPGLYVYTDQPSHVERIEVVSDDGQLCARFVDDDGVDLVPVEDMAGSWKPA